MLLGTPARSAGAAGELVRAALTAPDRDVRGKAFRVVLLVSLGLAVAALLVLLVEVVTGGWDVLTSRLGDFLTGRMSTNPEIAGLAQGIRGTFFIGAFVVLFAFPIGVGAAIYLEEYATRGRFARFVDLNIRNLAGVPSVVYGILGLTIFVNALREVTGPGSANGRTVVSAGLTLAVLVLPIVIITAAESIRAVPSSLREAGFGVGATRWEVVRSHVLPYAAPGILTGTVLALARALGEAAPLILVGATTAFLSQGASYDVSSLQERFTALPTIITTWASRPGDEYEPITAAAIVVLLGMVLVANAGAIFARNHFEKKRK